MPRAKTHAERYSAWATTAATGFFVSLGLPMPTPESAKKCAAKLRAIQRRADVAAALAGTEEQSLRDQGYALSAAEKGHRSLTGMDDGHAFSVRVPLRVRTIREALDWLRPDEVGIDALRQGEWFFVPRDPEAPGTSHTDAGSERTIEHQSINTFDASGRHMPAECLAVLSHGDTMFIGRNGGGRSHSWIGRPHIFAKGVISHPEHGSLDLGDNWHEVIPNRAHGPFQVGQLTGGLD